MEKSISILKTTTVNNQTKTKMNINRRRKENNFLISDLEAVRASKREFQKELENRTLQIQKLKLEKQKIQREFDFKLSQIESETLNRVKQVGLMNAAKESQNNQQDGGVGGMDEETLYKKGSKPSSDFYSNE